MLPELEEVPVQSSADSQPFATDFLTSLGASLNLPDDEPPIERDVEPATPVSKEPETTLPPPVKPDRPEARKRIEEKEMRTKLTEYEKELEELRPLRTRVTELDTSLLETKTLAEQRAAEKKLLEDAYRNEVEVLPDVVINELPEVQEAMTAYNRAERELFPTYLNDPSVGEPLKKLDVTKLNGPDGVKVADLIKRWEHEEYESKADPDYRSAVQHVVVSHIAQILGVNTDNFMETSIGGKIFNVIQPTHPVYQKIAMGLTPYVEARNNAIYTRTGAQAKAQEVVGSVVTQRIANSRKMFSDLGVTLQGDELKSALSRSPDNTTLRALSLLHSHSDLAQELLDNTELELLANGHFRPNLDLAETDPQARTTKANALKARIGMRAAFAPMVTPLAKLTVRQEATIAELKTKLAAYEKDASKDRTQIEPGGAIGDSGSSSKYEDVDQYADISRRLGIL